MAQNISSLLPSTDKVLHQFSERLRLARLRRRLTAKQVAERAGMSPMTLRSLERGGSGVTIGAYLAVMQVLGIEKDFDLLAKDDWRGRELQDSRLYAVGKRGARTESVSLNPMPRKDLRVDVDREAAEPPSHEQARTIHKRETPTTEIKQTNNGTETAPKWIEQGGFANAETLSELVNSAAPLSTRSKTP